MNASRKHYAEMAVMTDGERHGRLTGLKGRELAALLAYAEGREETPTRDKIMGLALVVAGERYLAKQALKAAKKAKRIF